MSFGHIDRGHEQAQAGGHDLESKYIKQKTEQGDDGGVRVL